MQASFADQRAYVGSRFNVLNNNIRCYGGRIEGSLVRQRRSNQSHQSLTIGESSQAAAMREISNATLSALPSHLLIMWREYTFGLARRKPARLFTTAERNRKEIRQKYYRWNVIWQCMDRLVRAGRTPERAADELYRIYGHKTPVTWISELIVQDKKRFDGGYHPNLGIWNSCS